MMAVTMQRRGYKTAILDADITGPSIPKVFNLKEKVTGNTRRHDTSTDKNWYKNYVYKFDFR